MPFRSKLQRSCNLALCAMLLAFMTLSCSKPAAPTTPTFAVTGRVYLNEKPLAGALVVFHPVSGTTATPTRSYAQTLHDGSFQLSTFTPNDGAPAGTYRVSVHLQDEGEGVARIPSQYSDPASSGLRVQVKSEPANATFQLRGN